MGQKKASQIKSAENLVDDAASEESDMTENHSYVSELDESDILAAKKRLDFYEGSATMQSL